VFKSVGINQSTSKKDTLGQDPWCGKTGSNIAFKKGFTQPNSWENYECMDAKQDQNYCLNGSQYTDNQNHYCPGTKKCCLKNDESGGGQ